LVFKTKELVIHCNSNKVRMADVKTLKISKVLGCTDHVCTRHVHVCAGVCMHTHTGGGEQMAIEIETEKHYL
jgi:hypothetical protein